MLLPLEEALVPYIRLSIVFDYSSDKSRTWRAWEIHYFCIFFANWHSPATLTEVFPCFFSQLWGKCQGIPRKDGARFTLFHISELFCSVYCLCVCICVLYYCHRVSTQLQLNISYHIISYHIISYHIISYIMSCHIISIYIYIYHTSDQIT